MVLSDVLNLFLNILKQIAISPLFLFFMSLFAVIWTVSMFNRMM